MSIRGDLISLGYLKDNDTFKVGFIQIERNNDFQKLNESSFS
jgi:hypothetical protein